jgi:hypothetical protein
MEQETYYRYAEEAVERVVFILHLVLLHQASYVALRSLVGRWSGVSAANVASVVETARAKMKRMLDAVHHLLFVLRNSLGDALPSLPLSVVPPYILLHTEKLLDC